MEDPVCVTKLRDLALCHENGRECFHDLYLGNDQFQMVHNAHEGGDTVQLFAN